MATKIIKTVFQLRRATTAEWLANKDVKPAAGEPCFDVELNTLKIGNGVDTYENLEAIGGVKIDITADGKSVVLEDGTFKLMGFDAASVGAQPQKSADGSIEWVMPADITELETTVLDLKSDVSDLKTNITDLQEIVTPSGDDAVPLLSRVEALETKMDGTGEGTVDEKIDNKINQFVNQISADGTINTFKELVDYVAEHGNEFSGLVSEVDNLQKLVGNSSVSDQINSAISASGHITKEEAEATLLSKVNAKKLYEHIKYEVDNVPVGTLVDYDDKEIRIMCPANAQFVKQTVGAGGDANTYYCTFKTYAPDGAVGYIEHLGGQVDPEVLTDLKTDQYGRKYQPSWLGLAKYDAVTDTWNYYGKNSTVNHYVGWDYQIDWYDINGIVIESDRVRINLSNEACHNVIEPYYMTNVVKEVAVNGTLLDIVNGRVNITIENTINIKGSDEIDVAEDGTLSIKTISFDKIVQKEEDTIIMDGGSAV